MTRYEEAEAAVIVVGRYVLTPSSTCTVPSLCALRVARGTCLVGQEGLYKVVFDGLPLPPMGDVDEEDLTPEERVFRRRFPFALEKAKKQLHSGSSITTAASSSGLGSNMGSGTSQYQRQVSIDPVNQGHPPNRSAERAGSNGAVPAFWGSSPTASRTACSSRSSASPSLYFVPSWEPPGKAGRRKPVECSLPRPQSPRFATPMSLRAGGLRLNGEHKVSGACCVCLSERSELVGGWGGGGSVWLREGRYGGGVAWRGGGVSIIACVPAWWPRVANVHGSKLGRHSLLPTLPPQAALLTIMAFLLCRFPPP